MRLRLRVVHRAPLLDPYGRLLSGGPADVQQQPCYVWGWMLEAEHEQLRLPLAVAHAQVYVDVLCAQISHQTGLVIHAPKVRLALRRKRTAAFVPLENELRFAPSMLRVGVLVHELTHAVILAVDARDGSRLANHGPAFCGLMTEILVEWEGISRSSILDAGSRVTSHGHRFSRARNPLRIGKSPLDLVTKVN